MKRLKLIVVCLVLGLLIFGCGDISSIKNNDPEPDKGSVSLVLNEEITSRTFLPNTSMAIDYFEVIGDGPGNNHYELQNVDPVTPMVTIENLTIGTWMFIVNAYNDSHMKIGTGSGQTTIYSSYASGTNNLIVTVSPLGGNGTATIDVRWTEAASEAEGVVLDNPTITGELKPYSGRSIWLPFNFVDEMGRRVLPAAALRAYASLSVAAGYYTNIVLLYEDGVLAAGGVEVIRIVAGLDTFGRYDFVPDPAKGSINVNINVQMQDPLDVRISGAQSYMAATDTMTISGRVMDNLGPNVNVVYVWYDNGIAKGTIGQSLTLDRPFPGRHRIDLTAFTADGKRAGSATQYITVDLGVEVPNVSVEALTNNNRPTWSWDPVTGAEGYRYRLAGDGWTNTADTEFTPTAPLSDGNYTLEVQAKKTVAAAEVWSGTGSATTRVDATPPAIPVISGADRTINTRPTWSWSAVTDADLYAYSLDADSWVETTELSFTPSADLSYANHVIEVRARDTAGNWSDPASFTTLVY